MRDPRSYSPLPMFRPSAGLRRPTTPSADSCAALTHLTMRSVPNPGHGAGLPSKFDRRPRVPAGSTVPAFDGCGLRGSRPARPAGSASYPISVRQAAGLLHASFRPRLATTPLRFANPSPPSGWIEDLHLQAVEHARHTVDGRDKPWSNSVHWSAMRVFPQPLSQTLPENGGKLY